MTMLPSETNPPPIGDFVQALLSEQQTLTAVDTFARSHETNGTPAQAKYYRDLIPATTPEAGQQYGFEVDLDLCSGCKACVAACHTQNGLEEDELWRNVGQLVGGTSELPVLQHVTTACHHCLEPACLSGCPVEAYEKDPVTGIVRHLDDQCIGCQYCMLTCPYDVPVYSRSKGIVRKCDMCEQRLSAGEAPACVQSCPNQAIRIQVIDQESLRDECEANHFLPAAPEPSLTIPSTLYKTERALPRNLLPADYFSVQRAHSHLPLVFMLVLTQMSVGAFIVEQLMYSYFSQFQQEIAELVRPLHLCAALGMGMLGLAASVFHLGRPRYAYRAILCLRTSWLSREILAFGLFAVAATLYVAVAGLGVALPTLAQASHNVLGTIASATGLLAVFCSVMIYVKTRRPCWTFTTTLVKFTLTGVVLGVPTALLVSLLTAAGTDHLTVTQIMQAYGRVLCQVLLATALAKLVLELSLFVHLRNWQLTPKKRSAMLLTGQLGMVTLRRFFFGIVGGLVLPLVLLAEPNLSSGQYHPLFVGVLTVLMLVLLTAGELMERYLFFAASVSPRMPGVPGS